MIGLLDLGIKQGGLLTFYILHSLKKKPKTGYELINELKEKTNNKWTPSKGTIYPLLKKLESNNLIKIKMSAGRSKNIFEITNKGKDLLKNIHKRKKIFKENFNLFKELFNDLLENDKKDIIDLIIEIKEQSLIGKNNKIIIKQLKECINNLKEANK